MQQQYLGKDVQVDRSQEILIQVVYYSGKYRVDTVALWLKIADKMNIDSTGIWPVTFFLKQDLKVLNNL